MKQKRLSAIVTISNKTLREAVDELNKAEDSGFHNCRVELDVYGLDSASLVGGFKVLIGQFYQNCKLGILDENRSTYHSRKGNDAGTVRTVRPGSVFVNSLKDLGLRLKDQFGFGE